MLLEFKRHKEVGFKSDDKLVLVRCSGIQKLTGLVVLGRTELVGPVGMGRNRTHLPLP